jgi:hypothetical protein
MNIKRLAVFSAAFVGALELFYPLGFYLHIFCTAVISAVVLLPDEQRGRFLNLSLFLILVVFFFLDIVSLQFSIVCLAAVFLLSRGAAAIGVLLALLYLSVYGTIVTTFADFLAEYQMGFMSPFLISVIALFLFASPSRSVFYLIVIVALGLFGREVQAHAAGFELLRGISGLSAAFFIAYEACAFQFCRIRCALASVVMVAVTVIGWALNPPINTSNMWVMLPEGSEAYESKFFRDYHQYLNAFSIKVSPVRDSKDIPFGATLFLPWLTEPLTNQEELKQAIVDRQLKVVALGEHSDYGGIATRIRELSGVDLLARDLTVPEANSDYSGHLRASGFLSASPNTVFNRGASTPPVNATSRVLLRADRWWIEPHIDEWLWAGDYIFQGEERTGSIPLITSTRIGSNQWVVVGDTSAFVSPQIIADPRQAIRLLQIASQWPAFFSDIFLIMLVGLFAIHRGPNLRTVLLVLILAGALGFRETPAKWSDLYLGESGFNPRNFNTKLSDAPFLLDQIRIVRKEVITGKLDVLPGRTVIFAHVDDTLTVDSYVKIFGCTRVGRVRADEGPYIMDGQVCSVTGVVEPLIGSRESVLAFRYRSGGQETVVILDRKFLSADSPQDNLHWLGRLFGRDGVITPSTRPE